MTEIARSLGEAVCQALPGLHAFMGCDSTSAFIAQEMTNVVKEGM